MMTVVTLCLATGCATAVSLPEPTGEPLGDGMYGLSMLAEPSALTRSEPWDANYFNPGLVQGSSHGHENAEAVPMTAEGPVAAAGYLFFRGYKATFSRVDGNTCRFSPSCSTFGAEASRRYGLGGVLMTFGRLQKNHSAEQHYPMSNPPFVDDPVTAYGFTRRAPRLDDFAAYDDASHAWYQHIRATRNLSY